jgi:hypothetical protein
MFNYFAISRDKPIKIKNQKGFEPKMPKVPITQLPQKWALPLPR